MPDDKPFQIMGFEAQRLTIHPGDALVLYASEKLSQAARANVTDAVKHFLEQMGRPDTPALVVDAGFRLAVVSHAQAQAGGVHLTTLDGQGPQFEVAPILSCRPGEHDWSREAGRYRCTACEARRDRVEVGVGEVWELKHYTKGDLTVQFVEPMHSAGDDWAKTRLLDGVPRMHGKPPAPGDDLTMRRSYITLTKRRRDLERALALDAVDDLVCRCEFVEVSASGVCPKCGGRIVPPATGEAVS